VTSCSAGDVHDGGWPVPVKHPDETVEQVELYVIVEDQFTQHPIQGVNVVLVEGNVTL
jgi:hypothetical protein